MTKRNLFMWGLRSPKNNRWQAEAVGKVIVDHVVSLVEDTAQGAAMAGTFYGINKISAGIKEALGFSEDTIY